jgi:VWFA-related protein
MIVLTDGVDLLSSVTSRTAAQAALRHDVTVYVVSTGRIRRELLDAALASSALRLQQRERARRERAQLERAEEPMNHLAGSTGGRALFPRALRDLAKAYDEVGQELRSRYLLGYYAAGEPASGYHTITVASRRPGVALHARQGYYRP